jgi:hypothetical protein
MRDGAASLLHLVGAVLLATGGCSHSEPPPVRPAGETPDEIVNRCGSPEAIETCLAGVETLRNLVAGDHADIWFWAQGVGLRTGELRELPADVVRVARAVVWEPRLTTYFERVAVLDGQLAEYEKKDADWKRSVEGQTFFIDRTVRRISAAEDAGYEFRRQLGKFVERVDSLATRMGRHPDRLSPLRSVAHETPEDIVRECEAFGAKPACRRTIRDLKKVLAEHPDDWFADHAVWLRTRRPSSASDAVRAARAVAWEPTVTERLDTVEALSGDIANYEANKDSGWKASTAGHDYLADRTLRRATAVQEVGREFKHLLLEFVKRLEQIAA